MRKAEKSSLSNLLSMLARVSRVRKEDFKEIVTKGTIFQSPFFTARSFHHPLSKATARFAVVVPKVVSTLSTERNKVKRRTWSLIEKGYPLTKQGMNTIFFMKKGSNTALPPDVEKEIKRAFTFLKLS